MFKKWLAIFGAAVLVLFAIQMLWATGGGSTDDHPWNGATGGTTGGTTTTTVSAHIVYPLTCIYIVRPAPTGGFYIMRISLPSGATAKPAAGAKKAGN